jgi:hypothetical protein
MAVIQTGRDKKSTVASGVASARVQPTSTVVKTTIR